MHFRLILTLAGVIAAFVFSGVVCAGAFASSPGDTVTQNAATASASRGIASARATGTSASLVALPPQSNLELLSHATLVGAHAEDATIELTVSLKLRHATRLKKYLNQANYQRVTPLEFNRLYAPAPAQVAEVKEFCAAHRIRVLGVSPDRTLIHTEATTEVYEHTLHIQINDYKLNGRRFYSTTDSPEIPRSLAPLVLGILGLNHGTTMHPRHHAAADLPVDAQPASSPASSQPD